MDDYHLNPSGEICARCGETARGSAFIGSQRLCHPNDPNAPDCYHLATVYGDWAQQHPGAAAILNEEIR